MNLLNTAPKTIATLKAEALEQVVKPIQKAIDAQNVLAEKAIKNAEKAEEKILEQKKVILEQEKLEDEANKEVIEGNDFIANMKKYFK